MTLFVWNYVDYATGNWHAGGGIVVIAHDIERARALIALETSDAEKPCEALSTPPDFECACSCEREYIAIHPDAGCC
jgi:hypothetical protein